MAVRARVVFSIALRLVTICDLSGEGSNTGDLAGTMAIGEEPEMADAAKPLGQHMLEEAANELINGERHGLEPLMPVLLIVLVSECHASFISTDQTAVGDGDAMGIAVFGITP